MSVTQTIENIKTNGFYDEILQSILAANDSDNIERERLYKAYTGIVPILTKKHTDPDKVNNKLVSNYRQYIVDQATSYLVGNPITYDIDKQFYSDSEYDILVDTLSDIKFDNKFDDLDTSTAKDMITCGYACRLIYQYTNDQNQIEIKLKRIEPWKVIFIESPITGEVLYSMIIYTYQFKKKNGTTVTLRKLDIYNNENIEHWKEILVGDSKHVFVEDVDKPTTPHLFKYVPVIKFSNNDELMSDFKNVESYIDAVDKTMSDVQDEIEEYRLAYLGVFGDGITNEADLKISRKSGTILIPKEADVKFITKQLQTDAIQAHLKTLDNKIWQFSFSVDLNDEKFGSGAASGEARKYKLLPLVNKTKVKERKFSNGLREQFRCIFSHVLYSNVKFEQKSITFVYAPNLPQDLSYFADIASKFKGFISDKTLLGLIPFIDDIDSEIEQMRLENKGEQISLDDLNIDGNTGLDDTDG